MSQADYLTYNIINDKNIDIHNQGEISRIINIQWGMYNTI